LWTIEHLTFNSKASVKDLLGFESNQVVASSNLVRPILFKREKMKKFQLEKHVLVPKHLKLSEKEKKELFEKYNISLKEIPSMLKTDPAIQSLNPKPGDVIKIIRKSRTSGEAFYYRGIVNA